MNFAWEELLVIAKHSPSRVARMTLPLDPIYPGDKVLLTMQINGVDAVEFDCPADVEFLLDLQSGELVVSMTLADIGKTTRRSRKKQRQREQCA